MLSALAPPRHLEIATTQRKARGYTNLTTMRTALFLIAGKLDFSKINPHVA
ncbi:MAG: hypothetical protein VB142_00590 [Burkholderia sp.]